MAAVLASDRGRPARRAAVPAGGGHCALRVGELAGCGGGRAAPRAASGWAGWPVKARNASSRVGLRRASPLTCRPAAASRPATAGRIPAPSATGRTTRPAASSMAGSPVPSAASAAASCRGSWPGGDCRSSRSPPARALSWPGVPLAMTLPWSMMTTVPASRSASSMYWVVSSRLVPCAGQLAEHLPQRQPAAGVQAGGRLIEEQDRGRGQQAGGDVQAAAHAPGVGPHQAPGGAVQAELAGQVPGPAAGLAAGKPVEPADHDQVLLRRSGTGPPPRTARTGRSAAAPPAGRSATSNPATRARPRSGLSKVARIRTSRRLPRPVRAQQPRARRPQAAPGPPRPARAPARSACPAPRPRSPRPPSACLLAACAGNPAK